MPIYEYECSKCGGIHEIIQKISEKPLSKCPECSGKLHKLISQSSFHLKGTGWYATDYARHSSSGASSSPVSKKNDQSTDTSSVSENKKASDDKNA